MRKESSRCVAFIAFIDNLKEIEETAYP